MTGSPLPDPPPFWRTRAWWNRAGRTAIALYVATMLGFLGTLAVARGFGPHEFGVVVLAVAVASLIGTFLDLTLEEAVVHHGYRALARGDTAGVLGLIRASLVLDVSIGVVVFSGIVLLAAPLADAASAGRLDPGLVRLAALVTLTSTADSTMSGVLQLAGRPDLRAWVMAWTNLARLVGVLIAVQVGTPAAVIVAYAAANGVGALGHGLIAWQLVRRRGWRGHSPALRVPVRELFRFGFHTSITTSVAAANGALIPVLLGRIAGLTAVGNFKVAMFPVVVAGTASGPIRLVLYPEQARLSAAGDLAQLRQAVRTHTLAAFALSIPFAVGAWFALPWLLPLIYSEQFTNAVQPARVLLIAAVAQLCASWFKTLPAALGKPQLRTALTLLELALMIVLLLLLGRHGSEGAAIAYSATAVVSLIAAVVSVHFALRRAEAPIATPAVPQESVELTR